MIKTNLDTVAGSLDDSRSIDLRQEAFLDHQAIFLTPPHPGPHRYGQGNENEREERFHVSTIIAVLETQRKRRVCRSPSHHREKAIGVKFSLFHVIAVPNSVMESWKNSA